MSCSKRVDIINSSDIDRFLLVRAGKMFRFGDFDCGVEELNSFLVQAALTHQSFGISQTFLLLDKNNANIVGYFTFSPSSIKLDEGERLKANYPVPFMNAPCAVIGKFAVDKLYRDTYSGMGKLLMIYAKDIIRREMKTSLISLDADVSQNPGVDVFYEKQGFEYWSSGRGSGSTVKMWYSFSNKEDYSEAYGIAGL